MLHLARGINFVTACKLKKIDENQKKLKRINMWKYKL